MNLASYQIAAGARRVPPHTEGNSIMRYLLASAAIAAILATSAAAQDKAASQPTAQPSMTTDSTAATPPPASEQIVAPRDPGTGMPTGKRTPGRPTYGDITNAAPATDSGAAAPGACDNAINTKGTGTDKRGAAPTDPNAQPQPQGCLKTRTKSNQSNE